MATRSRLQASPDCEISYTRSGVGDPVLLIHGFPETSLAWAECAEGLAERFTVIVPDYRGAGDSSRPDTGYDKGTMAADLRALLVALDLAEQPVHVVGHDLGGFVALAYALQFETTVASLTLVEAVIPGTATWTELTHSPAAWHLGFHASAVAEHLLTGHERFYVEAFHTTRAAGADLDPGTLAAFARSYEEPGAMRAALHAYRTLPQDAEQNAAALVNGWDPSFPLAAITGERSGSRAAVLDMIEELPFRCDHVDIPGASHWIPIEKPAELSQALQQIFEQ